MTEQADASFARDTDRHALAAHDLTAMGKAVIDDGVKAVTPRPVQAKDEAGI